MLILSNLLIYLQIAAFYSSVKAYLIGTYVFFDAFLFYYLYNQQKKILYILASCI